MASCAIKSCFGLRLTVTVKTPTHGKVAELLNLFHGLNGTMTGLTCNPALHMPLMVELYKIGQHVNSHPFDGFLIHVRINHVVDISIFRPSSATNGHVTIHAHVEARHRSLQRTARIGVTILAIHLELSSVKRVVKWDWLSRRMPTVVANSCPLTT